MVVVSWTVGLLVVSSLLAVCAPELAETLNPGALTSTSFGKAIVSFLAPPLVTIWAVGITLITYMYQMLCSFPTLTFVASNLVSALFSFPLSTFLTIGTLVLVIHTALRAHRRRCRRLQTLPEAQVTAEDPMESSEN
jgi:hypothetical protein